MRVVVTGAAGMIGSNIAHGPQCRRRRQQRLFRPGRILRPFRALGCEHEFADVATGVHRYVDWLRGNASA